MSNTAIIFTLCVYRSTSPFCLLSTSTPTSNVNQQNNSKVDTTNPLAHWQQNPGGYWNSQSPPSKAGDWLNVEEQKSLFRFSDFLPGDVGCVASSQQTLFSAAHSPFFCAVVCTKIKYQFQGASFGVCTRGSKTKQNGGL